MNNLLTGKVVFELNLSVEVVRSSPGFSEGKTVLLVSILGFKITDNDTGLVITLTVNLEGLQNLKKIGLAFFSLIFHSKPTKKKRNTYNTVRGSGLDFELDTTNGVILGQKVLGGLSNIIESNYFMETKSCQKKNAFLSQKYTLYTKYQLTRNRHL